MLVSFRPCLPLALSLALFSTLLLSACAPPPAPPVFYPREPDLPRIQYLTTVSSSQDMKVSALSRALSEGEYALGKPYGIASYGHQVLVVDTRNAGYAVLDFDKNELRFVSGGSSAYTSRFKQPFGIAIAEDGKRYITDKGTASVLVFDRDEQFVTRFPFDPQNSSPQAVEVVGEQLFVSQIKHERIDILDRQNGRKTGEIKSKGDFAWPISITAVPGAKEVLVTDMLSSRILRYDLEGNLKQTLGSLGDGLGQFARPKGTAVNDDGTIFAVDVAFQNVQIFNPAGQLMMSFSEGGEKPHNLFTPADITLSKELVPIFTRFAAPDFKLEAILAVSEQGPGRVLFFGLGKKAGADYSRYEKQ